MEILYIFKLQNKDELNEIREMEKQKIIKSKRNKEHKKYVEEIHSSF